MAGSSTKKRKIMEEDSDDVVPLKKIASIKLQARERSELYAKVLA
jgi:hypothetical protein